MICDRCHKSVPIPDIKYLPKGKDSRIALCSACRSKTDIMKEINESVKKAVPQKKVYFCSRCKFKFKFDPKGVSNLSCPYCGKADRVVEHKMDSADALLKETLRDDY